MLETKPKKSPKKKAATGEARKRRAPREEKIILPKTKIKVVGIGGGGNSVVAEISSDLKKVQFVLANTDLQALKRPAQGCKAFPFGEAVTHHLGTGMDPQLGEKAAQQDRERIEKLFQGVDLTILVASLGGGTGSGAAPIFAEAARKAGSSILGIFTLPFKFEGDKKFLIARSSLEKIEPHLQGLILIANEKIFRLVDKRTPLREALSYINKILTQSLGDLIEVLYLPGLINIDFSDLKTILKGREKLAYLHSVAVKGGEERAEKISQELFQNPLYEHRLEKPKRILFNITSGLDLKIAEMERLARDIHEKNPQAKIIFGLNQQRNYGGSIKLTLLALGERERDEPKKKSRPSRRKAQGLLSSLKDKAELKTKTSKKGRAVEEVSSIKPGAKTAPSRQKGEAKKVRARGRERRESKREEGEEKEVRQKEGAEKVLLFFKEAEEKKRGAALRRNALDLKKEARKAERDLLEQEAKWDAPAFLRRKRT